MAQISLPNIEWRDGQPRFRPNRHQRKLGMQRRNLQHPDGRWFTLEEAQAYLDEIAADQAQRKTDLQAASKKKDHAAIIARPTPKTGTTCSVAELLERLWQEPQFHSTLNGRPNPGALAPKTIKDYKAKAKWLETFQPSEEAKPGELLSVQVAAIERGHAKRLHGAIWRRTGLPMANGVVAVLRLAFTFAVDEKLTSVNPFKGLKLKSAGRRVRVGTPAEIAALMAVCDNEDGPAYDPEMGDAIMLALYTGQRQADCLELVETDHEKGRLRFVQNKTKKRVSMIAIPQLARRLKEAKARRDAIANKLRINELPRNVVLSRFNGLPIDGNNARHRFADIRAEAAKVVPSVADFWFLDLRDTAVTRLKKAGCLLHEICAITGHSLKTATEVLTHYMEPDADDADAAMEKLQAWLADQGVTV